MIKQVMILGAAGNFGSKIIFGLAHSGISMILVGRDVEKLRLLQQNIQQQYPNSLLQIAVFDINQDIIKQLSFFKPFIVVNTCGPFQTANYSVAIACIKLGINYIDLADSRQFVCDFHDALNNLAIKYNSLAITGASTVPCLSSAVLEHYKNKFSELDSLIYGITPGQKTERGLATTASILSYVGKPLVPYSRLQDQVYGWQDLYLQTYPIIGKRWMANCDIPDLELLPKYYGLKSINFSAGMENTVLHFSIWILSWLIRLGLPINLASHAEKLLNLSHIFDYFGSDEGGMHMVIKGLDHAGKRKIIEWFIIAKNGHGPYIPTIPAIFLVKQIIKNKVSFIGAMPCIGLITLDEYLNELKLFNIEIYSTESSQSN